MTDAITCTITDVEIRAPRDDVFAFLADSANFRHWSEHLDELVTVQPDSDPPSGETQQIVAEPDGRIVVTGHVGGFAHTISLTLRDRGPELTAVDAAVQLEPPATSQVVAPIGSDAVFAAVQRDLAAVDRRLRG
jgi:uncharacterized protein YndB with AHSA1/START domain